MIREIIDFMKYLRENSPIVFEMGLDPSKGLHIWVEFDENGDVKNFPGERGKDWDYYDGKNMTDFLEDIIKYEQYIKRIGTTMNKVFDKKKQIFSCSPYAISFKKKSLENNKLKGNGFDKIKKLLEFYFKKAINECFVKNENNNEKRIESFHKFLKNSLETVSSIELFHNIKKDDYINIYLKLPLDKYDRAHNNYLKKNLFNTNDFNSQSEISDDTYGLSGFFNGMNSKKPFLQHKTAVMYKGVAERIKAEDTIYLNDFDVLLRRKIFPNPLPVFIDKREFKTTEQMINIFNENKKLSFNQILNKLFEENNNLLLENYYLLFFNYKNEIKDFDFVPRFRYSMKKNGKYPKVINLFGLKENKELKSEREIRNIFTFEWDIVKTIFNNSLVRYDDKKDVYSQKYFDEVDPQYVSGGDLVYLLILKYRQAFYDYIYKSREEAITCMMWDDILWNSILSDIRHDQNFNKDYSIKEKLNIWFSFYNYFVNNNGRIDMAAKIVELLEKVRSVANDDSNTIHLDTLEEVLFASGQVIYFMFTKSHAGEKTHAMLEPFIQKTNLVQLQNSIANLINTYKHELSFGQGRFERLCAEILSYETDKNLKPYQRFLLAGYFAQSIIFEKKNKETEGGENE